MDTEQLSVFVFIDSLVVSASQDAGGYPISRQKKPRVAFGLPYLLTELFYHIFLPMVLRRARVPLKST